MLENYSLVWRDPTKIKLRIDELDEKMFWNTSFNSQLQQFQSVQIRH